MTTCMATFTIVALYTLVAVAGPGMAKRGSSSGPAYETTYVEPHGAFQIRHYGRATWLSSSQRSSTFRNATSVGLERLLSYVASVSANDSTTTTTATKPVLTDFFKHGRKRPGNVRRIRVSIPAPEQARARRPSPESGVKLRRWHEFDVAVSRFSDHDSSASADEEAAVEQRLLTLVRAVAASPAVGAAKMAHGKGVPVFSLASYDSATEIWVHLNLSSNSTSTSPTPAPVPAPQLGGAEANPVFPWPWPFPGGDGHGQGSASAPVPVTVPEDGKPFPVAGPTGYGDGEVDVPHDAAAALVGMPLSFIHD